MLLSQFSSLQYCYDYLLGQIPVSLLFYSHIPAALISILFGIYLLYKVRDLQSKTLFIVLFFFALWSIGDLITWFSFLGAGTTMFWWGLLFIFNVLFSMYSYYFLYTFTTKHDLPSWQKIVGLLLFLPVVFQTYTGSNLILFDSTICEAWEDTFAANYLYFIQTFFFGLVAIFAIYRYRKARSVQEKREVALAGTGVGLFLGFFLSSTWVANYLLTHPTIEYAYNYSIYGLFGMPVLLVFLGVLIVRYKAFDLKIVGAQMLVLALIALIGSQYFFTTSTTTIVLISVTLFLSLIGGYFLVQSVKKEVKQREQLEELTQKLESANERLKALDKMKSEFVSIASHQLRSPITAIRGYVSMLVEGSYGKFPDKAKEVLERIAESSKFMASSIEDYLNVSRIEAGNMKYELSDFNLKEQTERVADELRQVALKKGLVLLFRSDVKGSGMVNADIGKTRQVIMNFIDNAIKYSPKGTVTVIAHDDPSKKKMWVTIHDTGIGMSKETLSEVFDKFVRAKNANQINVTGTGLGLYVAKKMASGMGGKVWAESEGEGKGSSFYIEFPMLPGKAASL